MRFYIMFVEENTSGNQWLDRLEGPADGTLGRHFALLSEPKSALQDCIQRVEPSITAYVYDF